MPKGVTFDFEDGTKKKTPEEKLKNQKGKMEIAVSGYVINKGIAESTFN
jgi:hypothetical protein